MNRLVSRKELLTVGTRVWLRMPIHGVETKSYGRVEDLLSIQFTIAMEDEDGCVRFRFYNDRDWGLAEVSNG